MAGNANSGRRSRKSEPITPPDGAIVRPKALSHAAVAVWDELAPIALAMGTLTVADVAAFATLCELQANLRGVSAHKGRRGYRPLVLRVSRRGVRSLREHEVVLAERRAAAAVGPWLIRFKLDPSAAGRGRGVRPPAPHSGPTVRDFAARARARLKPAGGTQ